MVTRAVILACLGFLVAGATKAGLQLTPRLGEHELDGVIIKRLVFADGGPKEVTYVPPRGWDYVGSAGRLLMHPPNKQQAEGTVTVKELAPEEASPFTEESLKALVEEVTTSLPEGSTNVAVTSQEIDAIVIGGKGTMLVTLSYTIYGQNLGRSVMILNRGNEQLRFQLTCLIEDFKELQTAFFGSHFTWINL